MTTTARPSPALIVALIALVAALAGSAVALPGKNKVDKNDIKKNAVKGKQVLNESLTGADVDESTLGQVPSAANAASAASATTADRAAALEGLTRIPPTTIAEGAPEATLATVGAFTIGLACNSAATSATGELRIRTSVEDSGWRSGVDTDFALDPGGFGTLANHTDNDAPDSPTFSIPNDAAFGAMTPDASTALDGSLQMVVDGGPALTGTCTAWGQVANLR